MASSVSSERAFSQGGITISKHCSRLKGDIVEGLQVLKCSYKKDLIFRLPEPSSMMEQELVDNILLNEEFADTPQDIEAWDEILDDSIFDNPDNFEPL